MDKISLFFLLLCVCALFPDPFYFIFILLTKPFFVSWILNGCDHLDSWKC